MALAAFCIADFVLGAIAGKQKRRLAQKVKSEVGKKGGVFLFFLVQ
jgi:hypothetical protein